MPAADEAAAMVIIPSFRIMGEWKSDDLPTVVNAIDHAAANPCAHNSAKHRADHHRNIYGIIAESRH
jgi:hypothetical protein